jgi:hypothetical protein
MYKSIYILYIFFFISYYFDLTYIYIPLQYAFQHYYFISSFLRMNNYVRLYNTCIHKLPNHLRSSQNRYVIYIGHRYLIGYMIPSLTVVVTRVRPTRTQESRLNVCVGIPSYAVRPRVGPRRPERRRDHGLMRKIARLLN